MPDALSVQHLAHITEATITFGDLTVFVGPQASGKSLVAQLWKLWLDSGPINPGCYVWLFVEGLGRFPVGLLRKGI